MAKFSFLLYLERSVRKFRVNSVEIILWKFVLRLYSCTRPMIPRFKVVASNATPLSSFLEAGAIALTTHILYIDIQVVSHIIIVLPLLSSKYISE